MHEIEPKRKIILLNDKDSFKNPFQRSEQLKKVINPKSTSSKRNCLLWKLPTYVKIRWFSNF